MNKAKLIVSSLLFVAILAIGGGVVWYVVTPHTPDQWLKYASTLETKLRGDSVSMPLAQLQPEISKTLWAYSEINRRFGKVPQAEEGLQRSAKIDEEIAKKDDDAIQALQSLTKDFTDEAHVAPALMDLARLTRQQADTISAAKNSEDPVPKYKEALGYLDEFLKRFPAGKDADAAIMEIGRIWQDGLTTPLVHAIDAFVKIRDAYPSSQYRSEALCRLGELYEKAHENELALHAYGQLLDEDSKSEWAQKALFNRGKLLAEKMDKPKEGEKDLERLAKEHPESPMAGPARSAASSARAKAAQKDDETFGKGRYGGNVPYDTSNDKPMPPAALFARFSRQHLDAQHYDLRVTFLPSDHRITVDGTMELINQGEDKNDFLLQLAEGLDISRATVNGKEITGEHEGDAWHLILSTPLKKGDKATIAFTYSGQFEQPHPESPVLAPPGSSTPPLAPPGESATQPATAPAPKPERHFRYNPQLALGDYGYGLGGAWYPVTIIGDIFTAKITFITPPDMEAIGQGEMVERKPGSASETGAAANGSFVFETREPIFGLYFAYGKYVFREKQVGPIKYYTYLREANADKSDGLIDTASSILNFYSDKFVPFPYEKLALIEVPLPPFLGGVGPASLMLLQTNLVSRHEVPKFLLAHELAHQWFGNLVPINLMDPGYNQWLSEGFATYCDALYTEKMDGPEALAKYMQRYGQLYFQFTLEMPDEPIKFCFPSSPLYRPIIYEKGAIVLHALRKVMGDDKFFLLMHRYADEFRNKPTVVDDFRHLADEVSGQDLSWFFDEWVTRAGYAHWVIGTETSVADGAGFKITLPITQPDNLIKMPVDITFAGPKGESFVAPNIMLDKLDQTVVQAVPFNAVKITLDEKYWVLHHPGRDNIWPAAETTK